MRILLLNDHYPPEGGGTAQVVKNLAAGFIKSSHDVLVLTTIDGKHIKEQRDNKALIRFLPIRYPLRLRSYVSLWNPKATSHIRAALKEFNPDVILANNIHSYFSYHSLRLLRKSGAPLLMTLHDVMTIAYGKAWPRKRECDTSWRVTLLDNLRKARKQYNPFRSFFISHYLKFPDTIVCVSEALRNVLAENGMYTDGVVHNGIAVEDTVCSQGAVKNFLVRHHLEQKKIILFGGRLAPAKGGKELIAAAAPVLRTYGAVLLIAGSGPDLPFLKSFIQERRITGDIRFLGQMSEDEMHYLYSAAYCVVVPSLSFDSFPTMNLEAMLHKKPVVATCFGGSKEAVVDGQTGYIVNPYELSSIRFAIENLLAREDRARAMGEMGHERLKRNFSIEGQVKKILAIADEIKHHGGHT